MYYNKLYDMVISQITADLTIGRYDNDLEQYTKDEITEFINLNIDNIDNVINNIIDDYTRDNDVEELLNPELDLIREYLYEHVVIE
jgi:ATP phosphoribosyltransferase regulatory subunit HisZ